MTQCKNALKLIHMNEAVDMTVNIDTLTKNLNKFMSDEIGIPLFFTITKSSRGTLQMQSQDIVDKMFPKMFKKLYVGDFGSGRGQDDTSTPVNFVRMHYFYEHLDGGSNGCELLHLQFDNAGTLLRVRRVGEYQYKEI